MLLACLPVWLYAAWGEVGEEGDVGEVRFDAGNGLFWFHTGAPYTCTQSSPFNKECGDTMWHYIHVSMVSCKHCIIILCVWRISWLSNRWVNRWPVTTAYTCIRKKLTGQVVWRYRFQSLYWFCWMETIACRCTEDRYGTQIDRYQHHYTGIWLKGMHTGSWPIHE